MSAPRQPYAARRRIAEGCYRGLLLCGWLAITLACVLAAWALFFILLGRFDFATTIMQLDNLAARFVAAGPERRGQFETIFWAASTALFVLTAYLRRFSLPDLKSKSKESAYDTGQA